LQSTLAVDALFFGLLTLVGAFLNETTASVKSNEQKQAALRSDYEAELQARDLLDARRQRAIGTLRDLQTTIARERSRARLLSATLLAVAGMIIVATIVTVYSFTLLDRSGISIALQIAFYALMLAPFVGTIVIIEIVRRLSQSEE
jgi:Flp pilus assembly protein TadB